ncbi:hypothetical protein ACW9KT_20145 [Hymenobacter sp. HD11105]
MVSDGVTMLGRGSLAQDQNITYAQQNVESYQSLKGGIWIYFLLLIFEGALRKWVFPGLATPLLIIRDPIALWLIIATWKRGLLPSNLYLTGMTVIALISVFTATFVGHGSLPVALFGARILLVHFPLIFVIGRIFNREDVLRIGRATMWIAIPMAVLIAIQFYSPQSAWVNRGVGGDSAGAGFSGALGFFRPPGTFSFTNGNAAFFSYLAPFILYFWLDRKAINNLLLLGATVALLLAIPLSISRTLLFQVGLSIVFLAVAASRKPEYIGQVVMAFIGGFIALLILSQTDLFGTASEAFTSRFESANESEGGLEGVFLDRFLGGLLRSLTGSADLPFFGYGSGMGTNVGSMLLTGKTSFLIAEDEWGRIVGELGPLLGVLVVLLRLGLVTKIAFASYRNLSHGNLLPWMLLSFGLLNIAQGQWSQPTSLGFSTLIGGLLVASLRIPNRLTAV